MNINRAIVVGRITADPELKSLPNGGNVTNFSIATNRVWKNQQGEKQESTEFHNVVLFGRTAEVAAQYLKKGQVVGIEGRLQTRNWEKDGVRQYRTEIIGDTMQMGPKAGSSGGGNEPQPQVENNYPKEEINPEDIPF